MTNCEECENYYYDEEDDCWYCDVMSHLDEDEYAAFSAGADCPMYRLKDEYRIVRHQN